MSDVIADDAFVATTPAEQRQQLWWLLHALGMQPDGVTVDTLLYESGGHPRVLVQTLAFAVAGARVARAVRITPDVYAGMRQPGAYSEAVLAAVREEVGDDGLAVLCTMIFFSSTGELAAALDNVTTDAGIELSVAQLLDVEAVTSRLRASGYLVADQPAQVRLCTCGVTHILRRADPHGVAKEALRRLADDWRDRDQDAGEEPAPSPAPRPPVPVAADGAYATDEELIQARLDVEAIEIRLHHERRRSRMLEDSLDGRHRAAGETSERARFIRDDREEREDRATVQLWRKQRVEIDLADACADAASKIERMLDHRVDVNVVRTGPAVIVGGRVMLRIVLESLIDNAGQAVDAHAGDERSVVVRVGPSAEHPGWAEVDIEDNGPGMPVEVCRRLERGEYPDSSRHEGKGQGLLGAQTFLRQFGGLLEVLEAPSATLGGAHVRLRIPEATVAPR